MRLAAVLIISTLAVAACASDQDTATGEPVRTTGAAGEQASPDQPASSLPSFDYSAIDYDIEPSASALRGNRTDPSFPPAVIDPDDIVSGGPPPDGIPPIDVPVFLPIDQIDFLGEDEGVVVVEINGEAKAYPIQILIWHEIVNDEVGGVPVTVTYCPLCNSALAFERQFGDRLLDFGTSGELFQSALVMYDRQTESLWAHFTGQGLVGHYAGAQLELVPAQTLGYRSFVEAYPEGTVLTQDTGVSRRYGENPYVGYDDASTNPIGGFISQPIDDQFGPKDRVVGIIDGAQTYGILLDSLAEERVVDIDTENRSLVVFHEPGLRSSLDTVAVADGREVGQTGVYVATGPEGVALTFEAVGDGFRDVETGSTWTVTGLAVAGPLVGERLEPVVHVDTFWFSWSTYQPDHVLIEP